MNPQNKEGAKLKYNNGRKLMEREKTYLTYCQKWDDEDHKIRVLIDTRRTENFVSRNVIMKLALMLRRYVNEEVELSNVET